MLLDLSAAFDTIDHTMLLDRLNQFYGIKDTALIWFASYLHGRTNAIHIDNKSSSPSLLSYGVPQGSVLQPILFTLYTSPLGDIIRSFGSSFHFYADDTQIHMSFDANSESGFADCLSCVQKCVLEIKHWMSNNMLKLNDDKTEVLYISSSYFHKQIKSQIFCVDGTLIKPANSARNIGIIFDECLTLQKHITSVCKSCPFHLSNIGRIRKYISSDACEKLIHSLISSRIDFCNSLLSGLL